MDHALAGQPDIFMPVFVGAIFGFLGGVILGGTIGWLGHATHASDKAKMAQASGAANAADPAKE